MENKEFEGNHDQNLSRQEKWLNSPERDLVETAVGVVIGDAIQSILPKIAKNFSPNESAEIINSVIKGLIEEPDFTESITLSIQDYQMKAANPPTKL